MNIMGSAKRTRKFGAVRKSSPSKSSFLKFLFPQLTPPSLGKTNNWTKGLTPEEEPIQRGN